MSIFAGLEQFTVTQARRKMRISRLCREFGILANTPMPDEIRNALSSVDMNEEWLLERMADKAEHIWHVERSTAKEYAKEAFAIVGAKVLVGLSKTVHYG